MDTFAGLATSTFSSVVGFSPDQIAAAATSSVLQTIVGTILANMNNNTPKLIAWGMIVFVVLTLPRALYFMRMRDYY